MLGVCVLTSLATFVYAAVAYAGMPDQVPRLARSLNRVALSDKSMFATLFVPALNLAASPMYALLALLTAAAKRSVRSGSGGRSVEAQDAFRALMTTVFCWAASIMVEKRFGLGYALNYGNRTALLIVAGFGGLMLLLTAVGQVGFLS